MPLYFITSSQTPGDSWNAMTPFHCVTWYAYQTLMHAWRNNDPYNHFYSKYSNFYFYLSLYYVKGGNGPSQNTENGLGFIVAYSVLECIKIMFKATSIPPNKQFCLLVKIVWKDQLFFVAAYQNHIYTERLWSWHGIDEGCIWFWYGTMQNNMSIQDDSIMLQNCCIGVCWYP